MRSNAEIALNGSTNLPVTFNNIRFSHYDQNDHILLWKRTPYINAVDYGKWKAAVERKDIPVIYYYLMTRKYHVLLSVQIIILIIKPDTWWVPLIHQDTHWIDRHMDTGEVFTFNWHSSGGPWKIPAELFLIHCKWVPVQIPGDTGVSPKHWVKYDGYPRFDYACGYHEYPTNYLGTPHDDKRIMATYDDYERIGTGQLDCN